MIKPLALYIGLRYTRAKRRNQFISFISLVSVLGIALGVGVLITVLSVMNGFDQQIQQRIFTMVPHVTVTGINGNLSNWQQLDRKVRKMPGVMAMAPNVTGQGMLTKDNEVHPVAVMGVDPKLEQTISVINQKMISGKFDNLKSGSYGIVLGEELAESLGVDVGNTVNLITPQINVSPIGILPRFRQFKVVGVFHIGTGFGFDTSIAYINFHDAQALFSLGKKISGLHIKTTNLFAAPSLALQLQKQLGFAYQVSDWTSQFGAFYHAVQMEKTMMFVILLLLVAIAAFNLVAGLVMLVNDKQADIAILRTFGATPKMILSIFVIQGFTLALFGTLLGIIGGIILSLNVTRLVNFIQQIFHVQLLTSGVYFVNYLPSQLQLTDVFHICFAAIIMGLLATIYPAWRAARTEPVEALRYE